MWRSLNPAATRLHKNLHRLIIIEFCFYMVSQIKTSIQLEEVYGITTPPLDTFFFHTYLKQWRNPPI